MPGCMRRRLGSRRRSAVEHKGLTFRQEVALILVSSAAGMALVLAQWWSMQPLALRQEMRAETARWLHRQTAGRAWRQGHAGMGSELVTGRRSPRYLAALGLGLLRDLAIGELERMKA